MTNKTYTDQEIKYIFSEKIDNMDDFYWIKKAIKELTIRGELVVIKKASKFEQAKTGRDIYDIAKILYRGVKTYGLAWL